MNRVAKVASKDGTSLHAAVTLLNQHTRQNGRSLALVLVQTGHDEQAHGWEAVAITPSAKQVGHWQVSYFGPYGFTGDCQCPSKLMALQRAMREGFVSPCPTLLDRVMRQPRFHAGEGGDTSKRRAHTLK